MEQVWVHDAEVVITDLERTLFEGPARLRHSRGVTEVQHALEVEVDRAHVKRITKYGFGLGAATARRWEARDPHPMIVTLNHRRTRVMT